MAKSLPVHTKSAGAMAPLDFTKDMVDNSIHIENVLESWGLGLVSKHGASGAFIRKGRYHQPDRPQPPTSGPDDAEYEADQTVYKCELTAWVKDCKKAADARLPMFSDLWGLIAESARAELRRSKDCKQLEDDANDPL